jgi:hypothetical protein
VHLAAVCVGTQARDDERLLRVIDNRVNSEEVDTSQKVALRRI